MRQRKTIIVISILALYCCPFHQASADIYQFTDENGTLHFTNVNGGGRNHKRVKTEQSALREAASRTKARSSAPAPISSTNIPSAYLDMINSSCNRHGVDPSLVHALVKVESDFNPYALSRKGAMGLMQLMPDTAMTLNVKDSFNPADNIDGGVKYLKYLIDRYEGNLALALAAYNSGETAVKKWGKIPPYRETQNYVERILNIYNGTGKAYVSRYTIYMGYGDDGGLILTDNPSNYQQKKLKARKKQL